MLLNCHTYYSFCYGTLSIEELSTLVKKAGHQSFALTDINNTSACLKTLRLHAKNEMPEGLKPVIGVDFRNGVQQQYIVLAINNQGFQEINLHLSKHLHENLKFNDIAPSFTNAFVIYPYHKYKGQALQANEYIGVSPKELSRLSFSPVKLQTHKLVALHSVSFGGKAHHNAHRLLRAIDNNTLLSKLSIQEQGHADECMIHKEDLIRAFRDYPHIINNTEYILNNCEVKFDFGKLSYKNKKYFSGSRSSDMDLLRSECENGLKYRYNTIPTEVKSRITKELDVIDKMNFASYFLINWDITSYARRNNFFYVGRGSGANSLVAYLLRITDVDPVKLDLYFERFINEFRTNAPDFDIDFSWTDRDDITKYIFDTYKHEHTALLGAYSTFQHDAVTRELGKVFGLPPAEIDKLQSLKNFEQADHIGKLVLKYSKLIHGFPSHMSIHSSGIIISEEPVCAYTGTFMPPKGYPTTQFSMLEAEDIGLYKFDILSQRGLGKIKDTLGIIQSNAAAHPDKKINIDIHRVEPFMQDEKVKKLLREGKTIGCFYVESPAMRMLLAKLKADDYLRLVAASSIIRPGVAKSGMMREYIVRFRNENLRTQARKKLPELYDILAETYGVMVYQEDVIKVAHLFAGLSLAEADYLRRGMSWKYKQRNEFYRVKDNFFANCAEKKYPPLLIEEIWKQIESFANFAFSKGHSASYAVESYQALYLKAYFPLEYMVATLNNGGGFYRKELYIHEARMHGAEIKMPCINNSTALCTIHGKTIFLGLGMISELEQQSIVDILDEKERNGPYLNLLDFTKRVYLPIEQMRLLIRAGSFDFTGKNKKELLWEIHALINPQYKKVKMKELFDIAPKKWKLPKLNGNIFDAAFEEIELLGFSLCSPFDLLRDGIPTRLTSAELPSYIGKTINITGYLITIKHAITSKGDRMHFGTFIDIEGRWIDTVHFPPSAKQFPFTGPGCYLLKGKVSSEYDFISLEVDEMKRLAVIDREKLIES
ncbi:MAG: DNA polymerase III subunit alpha [Sphingobacteriaceae bacterium]|nr:DNA polymerase III subunit alpha [Sphingobacteriaceae bacterium]